MFVTAPVARGGRLLGLALGAGAAILGIARAPVFPHQGVIHLCYGNAVRRR